MKNIFKKSDILLLIVSILCGIIFIFSINILWPLANINLFESKDELVNNSKEFLSNQGFSVNSYKGVSILSVNEDLLNYVEENFGYEQTQEWIEIGEPIYLYRIFLKKSGEINQYYLSIHPKSGVLSWEKEIQENEPGDKLDEKQARELLNRYLRNLDFFDLENWEEVGINTIERPERKDYEFIFESFISKEPELRKQLIITIAGSDIVSSKTTLVIPSDFKVEYRKSMAPFEALRTIGYILMIAGSIAALVIFLVNLNRGNIKLYRAGILVIIVSLCWISTNLLQKAYLFIRWDSLWPMWISTMKNLTNMFITDFPVLILLLAVVASGDYINIKLKTFKGRVLWKVYKGKLFDKDVAISSFRGYLLGLICGAGISVFVFIILFFTKSHPAIQPRGFFFYPINSVIPAVTTLLYFILIALIEETGYRYFAIPWLIKLIKKPILAVLITSLIYGLTHATLTFLPPSQPFWGRAFVMTIVGCIWGFAYLRYNLYTVIISHLTADLFIFNWPMLTSSNTNIKIFSLIILILPIIPFFLYIFKRIFSNNRNQEYLNL